MYNHDDASPVMDYFVVRKCTSSWEIEESVTHFIDLTYVIDGTARYFIDNVEYNPVAGDLLCIPKGSLRRAESVPSDLMECVSANFTLSSLSGEEMTLPFPIITNIGYHADIIALHKDLGVEWLMRAPGFNLKVRALLLLILNRYFELIVFKTDSVMMDKRIKRATRYIAEHYNEPLTIQQLAEMSGLNRVYFGNLFKESTGMSFRRYLTSIRLNHAEDMLRSGEFNIGEVAERCGFPDIYYFSRVFKENRGISPSKLI